MRRQGPSATRVDLLAGRAGWLASLARPSLHLPGGAGGLGKKKNLTWNPLPVSLRQRLAAGDSGQKVPEQITFFKFLSRRASDLPAFGY